MTKPQRATRKPLKLILNRQWIFGRTVPTKNGEKIYWTSEPHTYRTEQAAKLAANQAAIDNGLPYEVFLVEQTTRYFRRD